MKKIDIIVSTRGRWQKLQRMIDSIPILDCLTIIVMGDGEAIPESFISRNQDRMIRYFHNEAHEGAVVCRNKMAALCGDGLLYATDDIEFKGNAIQNALRMFNGHFRDDDGVVGFVQDPAPFHPTGVALVGKRFLNRYPGRQLFCPDYYHFACQEIYWLAAKLGKFVQCQSALVKHYHPDKFRNEMDETHKEARVHRARDMEMIKFREKNGLIWGECSE